MSHFDHNHSNDYPGYLDPDFHYVSWYPTLSYDPRLFGHPHEAAPIQLTEAFWHQLPDWAEPDNHFYHYVEHDPSFIHQVQSTNTMDRTTLKIGYAVGAKGKARQEAHAASLLARTQARPPMEFVDVYAGDTFVQQMPLKLLTRFSKVAAAAFPNSKSEPGAVKSNPQPVGGDVEQTKKKDWAEDDEGVIDVGKLTEQVKSLSTKEDAEPAKGSHASEETHATVSATATPIRKIIMLQIDGVAPPNVFAVRNCLQWMQLNKAVHGQQKLIPFHIRDGESVESLVTTYAAMLSLDMRPFPLMLRDILRDLVTTELPTAQRLRFFYDRLPDNTVLTRIITSCIEHFEKGHYSGEEYDAINELVSSDEWLNERFTEIQNVRNNRRKESFARRQMENGWVATHRSLEAEGAGIAPPTTARPRTTTTYSGPGQHAAGGRQRPRRQQQSNGKEKKKADDAPGGQTSETAKPKADRFIEAERKAEEAAAKLKATKEGTKEGNGKGRGGAHVPGADS